MMLNQVFQEGMSAPLYEAPHNIEKNEKAPLVLAPRELKAAKTTVFTISKPHDASILIPE